MKGSTAYENLPVDVIASALSHIDPGHRDTWVQMAMAIKTELGEAGFEIWDLWSEGASNYRKADARDVWRSVHPGRGIGIGTLIHHAQQGGFSLENASPKRLSPDEVRARQQARAEEERMALEQMRARHQAVAVEAQRIWEESRDAETHPYLTRKGVKAYGLRIGEWPTGAQALLVPIMDLDRKVWSLQAIFANENPVIGRDRDYLAGGKKRGNCHVIGMPPPNGEGVVVLCEGYATGASIHEATGHCTVVAFDSGNLKTVAYELRRRWPACTIVVAADNDLWTMKPVENPGLTAAKDIAEAIPSRVLLAVPEFSNLDTKPTDFNDLHMLEGIEAVRNQINDVLPPVPANDNAGGTPLNSVLPPFEFPHVSDKGQPLNTVENLAWLLDRYGIRVRYNVISKEVEIVIPGAQFSRDNHANVALTTIASLCARNRVPRSDVGDYILAIADANEYNPAAEWIDSRPWDGVDRITDLANSLDPDDVSLATLLLRRWMIGAVGCAFSPDGMAMQGVLVLQGAQGLGKTTWIMGMAEHNRNLVLESAILNPQDKDSVKQTVSYWLVELGELEATFSKSDITALRGFITKKVDELRLPYARAANKFPRRTAMMASVNEAAYLRDDTGNRRYWTIRCGQNLKGLHNLDMQQAWAQAKTLWANGEPHRLSREEMDQLNETNERHTETNPIEELVLSKFDWDLTGVKKMTATEVLIEIGYERPTNKQAKDMGTILRKLTRTEPAKSNGRVVFSMPPPLFRNGRLSDESGAPI